MSQANNRHETEDHKNAIRRPRLVVPASGAEENEGHVLLVTKAPELEPRNIPKIPQDKRLDALDRPTFFANWNVDQIVAVREFVPTFAAPDSIEQRRLRGLVLLRAAHDSQEVIARRRLAEAAQLLLDDANLQDAFRTLSKKASAVFYPLFFSFEMRRARQVMWLTKAEQFLPAIYCPDARTAFFVAAAYGRVTACRNCHKLFDLDSPRVDGSRSVLYCTIACGQRFRQRIYDEKQHKGRKRHA